MANAMEQALLLPEDMIEWRSMRKHEVFLNLKRDLALVSLLSIFFFFFFFVFFFVFLFFFFVFFVFTLVLILC